MYATIRWIILLNFILSGPLIVVAQSGPPHLHGIHPYSGMQSGNPPVAGPLFSFGIVGGGYYGPNSPFQPNGTGEMNPYRTFGPNSMTPPRPRGQEGPGGLRLPHPNNVRSSHATTVTRAVNSTRADELLELGDRNFRGANYRKAEERYKLAAKANVEDPIPHIHLAQVALYRADYTTAAGYLRDAIASNPNRSWLLNAPDIQSMYGEPGDFARQVAQLESYLQTHPDDRNAWFVLGAQNYFSGHRQTATDAFLRLTDRPPDEALSAFLHATSNALF